MIDRLILIQVARTIARRERGMYRIPTTFRQVFAIALQQIYAQATE